jgi:hypothetical protein
MKKLCLYSKINPPNNALRHLYALYWLATNPPLEAFLREPLLELLTHAVGGTCCATGGRFVPEIKWIYQSKPAYHSDISALSESGRSTPSRQTLIEIAQVLDVRPRERNALLLSAGFAPVYSEADWNSAQMQSVTKALERILRQHERFPVLVMDRYWNVLMTNQSAPRISKCFVDLSERKGPRNKLHLMFDQVGCAHLSSWDEAATSLIHRVRTEATGRVIDEKTKE